MGKRTTRADHLSAEEQLARLREKLRANGRRGGRARARRMTAKERQESARQGGLARARKARRVGGKFA